MNDRERICIGDIRCNRQRNADITNAHYIMTDFFRRYTTILLKVFIGVIAQFGRASDLHSEGPEFDSLWLHQSGKILGAQGQEWVQLPVYDKFVIVIQICRE